MVLMSHIREASKVTVNSSYFHPIHQHYTDEAHKAETVPSVLETTKFVMEAWLSPTEFFHWAFHQWKDLLIQQCKFSIITLHHYHEFNLYALVNSC